MDGMVKYTHHQVQQLGPPVIKPASSKPMENNKKGDNVSVSLCVGLIVILDVSAEGVGVGVARVSERPRKYTSHFPDYHNSGSTYLRIITCRLVIDQGKVCPEA